ncbi:hypothetical protein BH11MYX2_BH11MYX2_25870 [soil metagenome]
MPRLGELLVSAGVLTAAQVDRALRAQVMWGARFGTNLIELGFIDLDTLSSYLGKQYSQPAALARHFEKVDRDLQRMLHPDLAEMYTCMPLVRVGANKADVVLAASSPLTKKACARIADELEVEPEHLIVALAAELRIRYQLERVYNIARPARLMRSPGKTIPPFPAFDSTEPDETLDGDELLEVSTDDVKATAPLLATYKAPAAAPSALSPRGQLVPVPTLDDDLSVDVDMGDSGARPMPEAPVAKAPPPVVAKAPPPVVAKAARPVAQPAPIAPTPQPQAKTLDDLKARLAKAAPKPPSTEPAHVDAKAAAPVSVYDAETKPVATPSIAKHVEATPAPKLVEAKTLDTKSGAPVSVHDIETKPIEYPTAKKPLAPNLEARPATVPEPMTLQLDDNAIPQSRDEEESGAIAAPHPRAAALQDLDALDNEIDDALSIPHAVEEEPSSGRERRKYVRTIGEGKEATPPTLGRIAIRRVSAAAREAADASSGNTIGEATRAIRRANNRERVAELCVDTVFRFAQSAAAASILVVRGQVATSWKGFIRDGSPPPEIAVPLDQPGLLPKAVHRNATVRSPSTDLSPIDQLLMVSLAQKSGDLVVVPVSISKQVMCVIALVTESDGPIATAESVAAAAGAAFARLMRDASR